MWLGQNNYTCDLDRMTAKYCGQQGSILCFASSAKLILVNVRCFYWTFDVYGDVCIFTSSTVWFKLSMSVLIMMLALYMSSSFQSHWFYLFVSSLCRGEPLKLAQEIQGSKAFRARFGTSISGCGDINVDGFMGEYILFCLSQRLCVYIKAVYSLHCLWRVNHVINMKYNCRLLSFKVWTFLWLWTPLLIPTMALRNQFMLRNANCIAVKVTLCNWLISLGVNSCVSWCQ